MFTIIERVATRLSIYFWDRGYVKTGRMFNKIGWFAWDHTPKGKEYLGR